MHGQSLTQHAAFIIEKKQLQKTSRNNYWFELDVAVQTYTHISHTRVSFTVKRNGFLTVAIAAAISARSSRSCRSCRSSR